MAPPGGAAGLTVAQLKMKLRDLGLPQSGSKAELAARYEAALAGSIGAAPASERAGSAAGGGGGTKRSAPEPVGQGGVANGKRARVEEEGAGGEGPRAAQDGDQGQGTTLSVKYAGKDQAKSRNICIRGLPSTSPDVETGLRLLFESLGLTVSRLKTVPNPREGGGLAMVQVASEDEAAFAIIALDGEDGASLFASLSGAAEPAADATAETGAGAPLDGNEVPQEEELERFRETYPMDSRAFDYIKVAPPEVQRRFLHTFRPPTVQEDYSKIVTVHLRFCLRQHEEHAERQARGGQFGGGSIAQEELDEFLSRFPMDERAFEYLKVAPREVQQEVLRNFRPAAEEHDFSRMITAHIKHCMKLLRNGSLKAAPAPAPAAAAAAADVPQERLEEFRASFPMDEKAFDYLKVSPPAVQLQVVCNFRPQAEETDYSRMVTAYVKFCTRQVREGWAAAAPLITTADPAVGSLPDAQLEEFRSRFPMDERAFDYLRTAPAPAQERVVRTFRPQVEEQDYSRMVTAHVKFCLRKLREEGGAPPVAALSAAEAAVTLIDDLAARLEHFRATFPMDERAFDYLIMAPPGVQERVVSTFRPQSEETDYSRMVTAHITYCTRQQGEAAAGAGVASPCADDGSGLPRRLEDFRASFPMDDRAFEVLCTAPVEVQMKVLSTFRPQSEETDYSRMVMAHVKFCLRQHRDGGGGCGGGGGAAAAAAAAQPAAASVLVEWNADGTVSQDTLEQFREAFPMDSKAFDYLKVCPPEVQARVVGDFRPQAGDSDYSRMVTGHINHCLRQAREVAGSDRTVVAEQPGVAMERTEDGAVAGDTLEQFRERFPMDERAFDYLKVSATEVQARVVSTFRPQAEETDYSRMVMGHVRHCTRLLAADAGGRSAGPQAGAERSWTTAGPADGAVSDEGALEQFRGRFPMDERAFDYLKTSPPEVQVRVLGTFRPQREESDYSRMVTAHVKYCLRQHREGSGAGWWQADSTPAAGDSGVDGTPGSRLEEFRASFPMDERAFDYLKVAPAEVQERVVRTFNPARQESDYSRMVTGHVRFCLRQHRDGVGGS